MKKIGTLIGICFLVLMGACTEGVEETATDPNAADPKGSSLSESLKFEDSSFSPYLQLSEDKLHIRMAFSFFPDGTDFNFKDQTLSIPCSFLSVVPEGVDVQLSPPLIPPCQGSHDISFNASGEKFTLNGIVVPLNPVYQKLVEDFEIEITADGVRDSLDASDLVSDEGTLEAFYELIVERRAND